MGLSECGYVRLEMGGRVVVWWEVRLCNDMWVD
jgi:hypothetical protein